MVGEQVTASLPGGRVPAGSECFWSSCPAAGLENSHIATATFTMPDEDVILTARTMERRRLYLVVDLSNGSEATRYPYRFSATGPDLSDDACRTTELWLRRIPAGSFIMGSPEDEVGREVYEEYGDGWDDESEHPVAITEDYYIGVFEVTQRQWELVMGGNQPRVNAYGGATRPRENVSYDDIRGDLADAGWPSGGHAADADSFVGRLQARTGLTLDLPTEAQWEYACRAGSGTALYTGNLSGLYSCPNLNLAGRYDSNRYDGKGGFSEHTIVGCYQPNAWGLYDMHGNVDEEIME